MEVSPFADIIAKAAHSPQLFYELEWWSSLGIETLNIPQTGALPTELTRQWLRNLLTVNLFNIYVVVKN